MNTLPLGKYGKRKSQWEKTKDYLPLRKNKNNKLNIYLSESKYYYKFKNTWMCYWMYSTSTNWYSECTYYYLDQLPMSRSYQTQSLLLLLTYGRRHVSDPILSCIKSSITPSCISLGNKIYHLPYLTSVLFLIHYFTNLPNSWCELSISTSQWSSSLITSLTTSTLMPII